MADVRPDASPNNSGQGPRTVPPPGVAGWSWGAFLLNGIWGLGNKTWIALLAWIPYVGLAVALYVGVKGRELAWRNRRWRSVEHFNQVQRAWSLAGFALMLALLGLGYLLGTFSDVWFRLPR